MSANPYAAPAAVVDDVAANPEAESIRRAHINHEASIRAVGFLYYLGGVLLTIGGLAGLGGHPDATPEMALIFVAIGIAQFFAGWGVRAFRPWGRIVGCVLSALGLLAFPLGTLINGYILYLLLSKKGRTIFAAAYKDVVAATPHVKYRISIVVWIALALIVGLIVVGVLAAVVSG